MLGRRTPSFAAGLLAASLLGACGDSPTTQQSPTAVASGQVGALSSCAVARDSVDALVPQLFLPGSERGYIASNYAKMNKELRANGDEAKAIQYMWLLVNATLEDWYATPSRIVGGAASQKKVEDLVQGLFCLNEIDYTDASGSPLTLPQAGGAHVVTGGTEVTITSTDLLAATKLPAGALPTGQSFLVTVTPILGPLDTQLEQFGPYYEFDIFPRTPFVVPVTTAICLDLPDNPTDAAKVRLAHNRNPNSTTPIPDGNYQFGNIEILAPEPATGLGLACVTQASLGSKLMSLFLPKPLYAAGFAVGSTGTGGKVREYSPFGGVYPPDLTFDWGAAGWSWKQLSATATRPSEADVTNAVSSTSGYTGPVSGAFSMVNPPNQECSLYTNGTGGAPNASIGSTVFGQNTVIAVRREFILPGGATSGTIRFAIDNDMRVYINGVDKTPSLVGSDLLDEFGYWQHDGCAVRGDVTLSVTGLNTLGNSLVVIARDDGGTPYFDASVVPPPIFE